MRPGKGTRIEKLGMSNRENVVVGLDIGTTKVCAIIAEVGDNDSWQLATIGAACVSNDERHANQVLAAIVNFVRRERLDAEILDVETEIIDGLN